MTTTEVPTAAMPLAERIGPYRVLQLLGEGGMGTVYEAEETEAVRRRVALKVVRDRHASKEVLARFEIERQALAVMNHPGIAKVYAAGTTEHGQPYFAMELVRGLPITQFCDEHRLSVRERLELFIAVCNAVQHAHQRGLIHRDLKPSNILVTDADGPPEPKIIDFGIAKALGQQLTDLTLVTHFGHAIGTAAYMSPEQADATAVDVDTRADIYSLGVVLYEVLSGELPADPSVVGIHVFLARLMSRDTEPPSPSSRLDDLRTDPAIIARARRTDLPQLRRELRGDLDWIVMKAIDPDRNRRYASANGMALDIARLLADEPIAARPPSTIYRIGKFVRRKRALAVTIAVAAFAVLAGSIFTTVGMVRARRAEATAERQARAAEQVSQFLLDIFRQSHPLESGTALTAHQLLGRAAQRAEAGLAGQPELQGRVLHTIGTVYTGLGLYPEATRVLEKALAVREEIAGASDTTVAATLAQLGSVATRRGDVLAADSLLARALAIDNAALGPEHAATGAVLRHVGVLRIGQGRLAEAESLLTRAAAINARLLRPGDPQTARDLIAIVAVYFRQERYRDAEPLLRRALAIQEAALGRSHPEVGATLSNLGAVYWALERYDEALPVYERARTILTAALPPGHPDIAAVLNNLAEYYWKVGRLAEAEPLFRQALAMKEAVYAPGSPHLATTLNGLAGLLRDQRRFDEAEPLYRRALQIREAAYDAENADLLATRRDYAALLRAAGRLDDARAMEPRLAPR